VVASFASVGRKERLSRAGALVPLAILHIRTSAVVQHAPLYSAAPQPTYLGLEKSCGRSRGPSGALARPRSDGLLVTGGGRTADMALEALVLRSRLPFSVVFWNLRTRSSAPGVSASYPQRRSRHMTSIPEEVLDSSPDTFDPERGGRSIVSMVRVPVRTGAAIIRTAAALLAQPVLYRPVSRPPRACTRDSFQASSLAGASGYAGISSRLSSGGESGVCVAGQRSARAQIHRKSGRRRGRRRQCRGQQKAPQAESRGRGEWKGTSVEVSSPPDAATATRLPGTLTPAPRIMPALTSQILILSSKQSPRRPAPCPPPAISPRQTVHDYRMPRCRV
jgi:hypothetical protein